MKLLMHYPGLHTVVSGGQTGADQAGLWAARQFCLKTGGWIPKGYRTQSGPMPSLGQDFNLQEHSSPDYPPRTKLNAKLGDATIRLASNFQSPGEKLTLKYCRELNKPVFDVILNGGNHQSLAEAVKGFIVENYVGVLNVAGNSDKADRAGFHFLQATTILTLAFQMLKDEGYLVQTDDC